MYVFPYVKKKTKKQAVLRRKKGPTTLPEVRKVAGS